MNARNFKQAPEISPQAALGMCAGTPLRITGPPSGTLSIPGFRKFVISVCVYSVCGIGDNNFKYIALVMNDNPSQ